MTQTFELELTAMAHGGSALGRHEGRVIFVPYAIPSERVRVELVEERKRWGRGRLVEILAPSPHRVEPPCPYFGLDKCGGCQFQHIDYEAQAEYKREVLIDQLARLGGLRDAKVLEIIGAADPWAYRNHVQFSTTPQGQLGFLTSDTNHVVPVEECLILDPLLDELWEALDMEWPELHRLNLRCGSASGDRMAIFELDHYEDFDIEVDFAVSCVILLADGEVVVLMGNPYLEEQVVGRSYRISANSFFQVNTAGAEALVALMHDALAPKGSDTLLELYCGVGLFGLSLADKVGRVLGVEADPSAAADFRYNAREMDHVELIEGDAQLVLSDLEEPVDLVLLDPPRSGAGLDVMNRVVGLQPRRIAYVSCDPASLARDARRLTESSFVLQAVQPVDLFPQTYHIESVALFTRQG